MTDSTLNRFLGYGTAAQRAAFTPSVPTPASGPSPLYMWFETDTGDTYAYAGGAWTKVNTAAAGGALTLLSTVTTSGSQASVTFSGISGSYTDLEIRVRGRLLDSTSDNDLKLQFNTDTGSNYNWFNTYLNSSGSTNDSGSGTTTMTIGHLPAATANASFAGAVYIDIPRYTDTSYWQQAASRTVFNVQNTGTGAGGLRSMISTGYWANTAAITEVKLIGASSGFANGSVVSLYGRT